jgi:hypothetical protein
MQNNSMPLGVTGWFQGDPAVFPAQGGAPNSYIAASFNNGAGLATISNWLLTPPLTLQNGATLTFWTRTVNAPFAPDRLQVRMSTNGASANVGTTATSGGDFTALLLDINPNYTTSGYPNVWTQFTVTVSGVPSLTTGRLAFRYFVENGGPSGVRSDYIGIDTMAYTCPSETPTPTPTPSQITLSAMGHKVRGVNKVDLSWTGATSSQVDIYRNGAVIATTDNDGAYTDLTGNKGRATYTYKVCEAGTSTCSNEVTVSFGGP